MRASRIFGLTSFFLASISAAASAEETAPRKAKENILVVKGVDITGRRPVTPSVDVARLVMRAPLPALRKPLVDPSGATIDRDPF